MTSINRVTLIGNIGQPPELKAAGNQQYARFTMATNENYQDRQGVWQTDTEWHTVKVWGPSADRCVQQLRKGNLVYIEGSLRSYEYESKRMFEIKALTWRNLSQRDDEVKTSDQFLPPEPPRSQPQPQPWHVAPTEPQTKWGDPHPSNTGWQR